MLERATFAWFLLACSQPSPSLSPSATACDIHCLEITAVWKYHFILGILFHDTSVTVGFLLVFLYEVLVLGKHSCPCRYFHTCNDVMNRFCTLSRENLFIHLPTD